MPGISFMGKKAKWWILLCCLLMSGPVFGQSLERAVEAFDFEEYDNAAEWLKPWAEKGKPEAQYRYGIMLEEGLAMKRDPEEARKWFSRAAENGHVASQKRLKKLRRSKITTSDKESLAFDLYREKADHGDLEAQYQLGFMYESGWGTPKDDTRAATWYEEAASSDHVVAQLRLGIMYLAGAGVAPSEIQASRWLQAASENGNKLAQYIVKSVLEAPANYALDKVTMAIKMRKISLDNEKKVRAYIKKKVGAAKARVRKEEAASKAQLAKSRKIESATEKANKPQKEGIGLDARGRKTLAWYTHNAESGNTDAQLELGKFYARGKGVQLNLQESLRWFQMAAEQKNAEAQYHLAMAYTYGIGVEVNIDSGREWLQRAVANGHAKAGEEFARLSKEQENQTPESVAVWWLRHWGALDPDANDELAYLYKHGRGVEQNKAKSMEWNAIAAKFRFERALNPEPEVSPPQAVVKAVKPAAKTPTATQPSGSPEKTAVVEEAASLEDKDLPVPSAANSSAEASADTGDSVSQMLELDKFKANWLWLLALAVGLLLIRYFAGKQNPEEVESPF